MADGTGASREIAGGWSAAFTGHGQLVLSFVTPEGHWHVGTLDEEAGSGIQSVVTPEGRAYSPQVSPDGRYLAYASDDSGDWEVYLTRFPSGAGKWRVSTAGGAWPRWDRKGERLFYVQDRDVMEVRVVAVPELELGTPIRLFTRPPSGVSLGFGLPNSFDITADGERFLILEGVGQSDDAGSAVVVIQNWPGLLAGR
jgi:Tol biopolymer transport system component